MKYYKFNLSFIFKINIPKELKECYVRVNIQQKPNVVIYLLKTLKFRSMLCFVSSKDIANRLNQFLKSHDIASSEFSSALHAERRTRIKEKFEKGKLDILVCSDLMARGMDFEHVDYVLLYDTPLSFSSYVHKVFIYLLIYYP